MRALWLIGLATLAGCNCKPVPITGSGELRLMPSALDWGSQCVKPGNAAFTVRPVTKTLTLQNGGLVSLDLEAVELDGGAGFTLSSDWPRTLSPSESRDVDVTFLPLKAGKVDALLTFTDATGKSASASLSGSGAVTAPDPVVALRCPGGRSGPNAELCWDAANEQTRPNPLMWLPDTVIGASAELDLQIGNTGCADLEVSDLFVDGGSFKVEGPKSFTVAGKGAADAGAQVLRVKFAPIAAGAQNGALTLYANVATAPVKLLGSGVQPSLQLCLVPATGPMQCATPMVPPSCDFSATTPCTGNFLVRNAGLTALTVGTIALTRGNAQFNVSGAPTSLPATLSPSGMTGDSFNLTITYTTRAQYDAEVLEVASNGGTLRAFLRGGQPGQLQLNPVSVDFGTRATGYDGMQSFEVRNVGQGPLTVRSVKFGETGAATWPAGASIFSVTPPAANTVVMPNMGVMVAVRFKDPEAGGPSGAGFFATELTVDTDDPQWDSFGGALLTVSGKTPCNAPPVAVVKVPANPMAGTSVTIDASASYDAKPDGNGSCQPGTTASVSKYEWQLLSVPASAGGATLTPMGMSNLSMATLQLGTCAPCSYVVRVAVYDDTPGGGRKSAFTDVTINAQ